MEQSCNVTAITLVDKKNYSQDNVINNQQEKKKKKDGLHRYHLISPIIHTKCFEMTDA